MTTILFISIVLYWYCTKIANYDEQSYISFGNNFTKLSYNITALAQNSSGGYGVAYLLNGVSNVGYWYQVSLAWNWTRSLSTDTWNGFDLGYEVFAQNGSGLYPSSKSGMGIVHFSNIVNRNDTIQLNLYFLNNKVVMSAYDWNTKAFAIINYSAFNATKFVGFSQNITSNGTNKQGEFTGLMTEEPSRYSIYYNARQVYKISNSSEIPTYALMVIHERGGGKPVFSNHTLNVLLNSMKLYNLTVPNCSNCIEAANTTEFITGR
jgi:hypothetical protein